MKKRSYLIIHGLSGSGEGHWQSWLYKELVNAGETVSFPDLPNSYEPSLDEWIEILDKNVSELEGEKIVICHSLGSVLWFHYAARVSEKKADRVLLVAPPSESVISNIKIINKFINIPMNGEAVKRAAGKTLLVSSDNDEYCPERGSIYYGQRLGIETEILPGRAAHINIKSGYGKWESVLKWALDPSTKIIENDPVAKETACVKGNNYYDHKTGAVSTPIYQCATFAHPALNETTGYDYSRQQNPTKEELERNIAILERGRYGFAFSTGMAAINAVLSMLKPGDHVIATDDLYGGTVRLFDQILLVYGIECTYTDTGEIENIIKNTKSNTKIIYIESPSNPMMKVSDLKRIAEYAHEKEIITVSDNTFLTPYFQNPLELGIDIVVHSGTKYISGHNDTLAGFAVTNSQHFADRIRFYQKSAGAVIGAFDSWLVLRGLKTLALRMERQQENAIKVAEFLKNNKYVIKTYYAGLPESDGYGILKSQASGFGAMISFEVDSSETAKRLLKKVRMVLFAESLGGVETLITYPSVQTHADVPVEKREELGINDRLLRLSVGIENYNDIISDIEQALEV